MFLCSWNQKRTRWLEASLVAGEWFCHHTVDRKGNVNRSEHEEDGVAILLDHRDVLLGDAQDWCHLLPSQASMSHEDADTEDVEISPEVPGTIEELVLETIDVTHWHRSDILILGPEEIKVRETIHANQHWRRADVILHSITKAELEEVDCHESAQHHT